MSEEPAWSIVFYADADGNKPVQEFLDSLDPKTQAGFDWAMEQLRVLNVKAREPLVKHIEGKLWELRRKGRGGIYRLFYFFFTGREIVFLHGFQKKTPQTPRKEIDIAQTHLHDYIKREGGE